MEMKRPMTKPPDPPVTEALQRRTYGRLPWLDSTPQCFAT
jgi:hypothetical protein